MSRKTLFDHCRPINDIEVAVELWRVKQTLFAENKRIGYLDSLHASTPYQSFCIFLVPQRLRLLPPPPSEIKTPTHKKVSSQHVPWSDPTTCTIKNDKNDLINYYKQKRKIYLSKRKSKRKTISFEEKRKNNTIHWKSMNPMKTWIKAVEEKINLKTNKYKTFLEIEFSGWYSICKLIGSDDKLRADLLNYSSSLSMHQQKSSSIQVTASNCWFNRPTEFGNPRKCCINSEMRFDDVLNTSNW